ncbi:Thioredoxin 6 domain containing protein [Trichuris trichiura]|uniref:Thioredoxin 6 domain containing protein n=1 Tax=Trichuris trichiura TaxID=36087 RepID=A0A077ZC57_TRITR|nr:Thioredoxin 6 domain containing protein [Trichuris trichiura]
MHAVDPSDVALVNFHAEWCRFSKMLVPVFSDASNVFPRRLRPGKEYRGSRSVDAFTNFIRSQLVETIRHSNTEEELNKTNIASSLRDECEFHAFIRQVLFISESPNEWIVYPDNLLNNVALKHWIHEKCIPLVREITFQNAEELTEEGRPFLILFYSKDNRGIVKTYANEVSKQLQDLKSSVNFLYADGHTFAHPLHHLGKSEADLPLLAIDSFRHMYLFPSINDLTVPGKLRQFILDLQSGKLHRDFHNVPPSVETTPVCGTESAPRSAPLTPAADSVFVKLKPANTRYTVLRDEL